MNLKSIAYFLITIIFLMAVNSYGEEEIISEGGGEEYIYDEESGRDILLADVMLECNFPSLFNFTGVPLIVEKEEYDHKKMAEKFFGTLSNVAVKYSTDSFYGEKVITGISYWSEKENKYFEYGYDGTFNYTMGTGTFNRTLPFSKEEAKKIVEEFIEEYGRGISPDAELSIEDKYYTPNQGLLFHYTHKPQDIIILDNSKIIFDPTVYELKFYPIHQSGEIIILDDVKYGGDYIEVEVNYEGVKKFRRHWQRIIGFKEEWKRNIISSTEALLSAVENSYKIINYPDGYRITAIDIVYHYHCWPPSERKIRILYPYWRFKCESMYKSEEYKYIYINAYTKEFIMCPWETPFPHGIKYRLVNVEFEEEDRE